MATIDAMPAQDEVSYQKRTADRAKTLAAAKERYAKAEDAWSDARKAYLEDQRFRAGDQWPQGVKAQRDREGRPVLTVDKLGQYCRQVINDVRQNRPQTRVIPVAGGDDDVAQAFQGIVRNIWSRSNADEATDWAMDCAVNGGFGFLRVLTEYASDEGLEQDIVIRRVRNPCSVLLDPECQMADGSDARFVFIVDEIPVEDFKRRWPKATHTDWDDSGYKGGWADREVVRVCEYFHVEEESFAVVTLDDGSVVNEDQFKILQESMPNPPAEKSRVTRTKKRVKWCRMTGAEVLEERDWLGKYIPVVPVYGEERDVDGKWSVSSLIRPAKDAQRLYNYSRSAFAERVALTPKAPWLAAAGQVEKYPEWKTANTGTHSVLRYDPIEVNGVQVGAPQRISPTDVPTGFAQDMQFSEHDIQASLGMYSASLGERSNEKSGKAIVARQREGDTATFHFADNLSRAIRQVGRILVNLIPKVYDTRRVVRLLQEDGEAVVAQVNPAQERPVEQDGATKIYNLGVGQYDVDVTTGPSYTTQRQEAAEAMMQMVQANPSVFQVIGDLMVQSMDWPGADAMAKRLKAMLPPQVANIAEDGAQGPSPEVQQVMQQAQQEIQQREQALQQMQAQMQQMAQQMQQLESQKGLERAQADTVMAKAQALKAEMDGRDSVSQERVTGVQKELEAEFTKMQAERMVLDARYEQLALQLELQAAKLQESFSQQKSALATAQQSALGGNGSDVMQADEVAPAGPDPQIIFSEALNGFREAIAQLRAPRTVTLPDGRQMSVQ